MQFLSLQPFLPSGNDFEGSKSLFTALGFNISWETGGMVGFERDGCGFILQQFDNKAFAENFMVHLKISSAQEFYDEIMAKKLVEKFAIRMSAPTLQPYGIEVNLIDLAGVCWHFVE